MCNLGELQPNLVPIPLLEQTYRVDTGDIFREDKYSKSKHNITLSIKRRRLPLAPAYLIAALRNQGQCLSKAVVDLKLPNDTDDSFAIYVPVSRAKRMIDLIIIRHFSKKF